MKITKIIMIISWAFAVFVVGFIMTDYLLIERDYEYMQYVYFAGLILLIVGPVFAFSLWSGGVLQSYDEYQDKKKKLDYEIALLQATRYEISQYFETHVKDKIKERVKNEMGRGISISNKDS